MKDKQMCIEQMLSWGEVMFYMKNKIDKNKLKVSLMKDLTRYQRKKVKDMFEGGYKVRFFQKYANNVLQQTIYFYFIPNKKVRWNK